MAEKKPVKSKKVCPKGHVFFKSSDCPACPYCERQNQPANGFLSGLGSPARRALENKGITSLKKLSQLSEKQVLLLHGIGPSSLPQLRAALKEVGLNFKKVK
jgi:predicted RecB family nuclease